MFQVFRLFAATDARMLERSYKDPLPGEVSSAHAEGEDAYGGRMREERRRGNLRGRGSMGFEEGEGTCRLEGR